MVNFQDAKFRECLKMEIELMKHLKSKHTVSLYDSYMSNKATYLAMELCDSDLRKKLNASNGKLPEQEAIMVFTHILRGFKELISLGYIHRDVKPENILIKGEHYKVGDFGFSCKADMNYIQKLDLICGTPLYMAPQLLNEQAYTAKCDIWSLGIMLYEMTFGYGPWVCRNIDSYRYNILNKPLSFPYNGKIGEHTKDLIKKCLVIKEDKRIGWK
jgi:serine/threonine protein kinase